MSEYDILRAWDYVTQQHGEQTYGTTGKPYLYHLVKVTERVRHRTSDETIIIAAILHDVVEDTECDLGDVQDRFGFDVARLVNLLTHHPGTTYSEYLYRVSLWHEATLIKVCDIRENLSNSPRRDQVMKYESALEYLTRDSDGVYE